MPIGKALLPVAKAELVYEAELLCVRDSITAVQAPHDPAGRSLTAACLRADV
jgi:hypothetical protein